MSVKETESEIVLSLPSKPNTFVKVLKYGAHIHSWSVNGTEKFWMSENSPLDGTQAIRGGIPLVFPVFGAPVPGTVGEKLPQHGLARISTWKYLGQVAGVPSTIQFGLTSKDLSESCRSQWACDFSANFTIVLAENTLTTSFEVENLDTKSWDFAFLYHTYFKIGDISDIKINGLKGSTVIEKLQGDKTYTQAAEDLTIDGVTVKVLTDTQKEPITIKSKDGKSTLFSISDRLNLPDAVVWNPWSDLTPGIPDFEPKDGYKNMVCVEAGAVGPVVLSPSEKWSGSQTLKSN